MSSVEALLARWKQELAADLATVDPSNRDLLIELRALSELTTSGLDPTVPRRFRAPVMLTILCRARRPAFTTKPAKSRRLAIVYRTRNAPVLIPDVAAPHLRIAYPDAWRSAGYQRAKCRRILKSDPLAFREL